MERAEAILQEAVGVLILVVEAAGAVVIVVGAVWGFARFLRLAVARQDASAFVRVRLGLARFLALGLEFQLASDVLRTAVGPSFRELGQLAAIATIRTALNYFLSREIAEERRQLAEEAAPAGPAGPAPGQQPAT
jgi:uncharacterized membrane protein